MAPGLGTPGSSGLALAARRGEVQGSRQRGLSLPPGPPKLLGTVPFPSLRRLPRAARRDTVSRPAPAQGLIPRRCPSAAAPDTAVLTHRTVQLCFLNLT